LGYWQALNLALYSIGVVLARHCAPSRVAEKLGMVGKADSVQRRLERFLHNPRIDWQRCCQEWSRWVLSCFGKKEIILLVDETKLQDRLSIMVVGLSYRYCCIPLAFWCYQSEAWPLGQVDLIMELLRWVAVGVPEGSIPVLQADRGLGTSPALMEKVKALGWHYLFRVQNGSKVQTKKGKWKTLHSLVKCGESWSGRGIVFKTRGRIDAFVHVIWEQGYHEPWCLVTNAPHLNGWLYAQRYWQEASFRDLKSDGWQWHCSRIWTPAHANLLVLVMSLAYASVLTLGTWVFDDPDQLIWVTKGQKHKTYSIFRLGLRYWEHLLLHARYFLFSLTLKPYIIWKDERFASPSSRSPLPDSLPPPFLPSFSHQSAISVGV